MVTITGQEILTVVTKGAYDNCIILFSNDERYLMNVTEILKFQTDFNSTVFNIVQKRGHKYLEVRE